MALEKDSFRSRQHGSLGVFDMLLLWQHAFLVVSDQRVV
jgi:hypothetical protein